MLLRTAHYELTSATVEITSTTFKSYVQLANATTPILTKIANAGTFMINQSGKVVSFGAKVFDTGVGYLQKGSNIVMNNAIAGIGKAASRIGKAYGYIKLKI